MSYDLMQCEIRSLEPDGIRDPFVLYILAV